MTVLIGRADGLYQYHNGLTRCDCPLGCVSSLAASGGQLCAVDNTEHLLWNGRRLIAVDGGIEALLCWRGHILTLSGETDSLTLLDGSTGQPVTLAPAGVYPQDMCLLPDGNVAAVCGGADGFIRLIALPALRTLQQYRVPGFASRLMFQQGALYVLCTVEDGSLRCLIGRLPLRTGRYEALAVLPGLPGAIASDAHGGFYAAAGEGLYHFPAGAAHPDSTAGGFGLIARIQADDRTVFLCDPVLDLCCLMQDGHRQPLCEGGVQCALLL